MNFSDFLVWFDLELVARYPKLSHRSTSRDRAKIDKGQEDHVRFVQSYHNRLNAYSDDDLNRGLQLYFESEGGGRAPSVWALNQAVGEAKAKNLAEQPKRRGDEPDLPSLVSREKKRFRCLWVRAFESAPDDLALALACLVELVAWGRLRTMHPCQCWNGSRFVDRPFVEAVTDHFWKVQKCYRPMNETDAGVLLANGMNPPVRELPDRFIFLSAAQIKAIGYTTEDTLAMAEAGCWVDQDQPQF